MRDPLLLLHRTDASVPCAVWNTEQFTRSKYLATFCKDLLAAQLARGGGGGGGGGGGIVDASIAVWDYSQWNSEQLSSAMSSALGSAMSSASGSAMSSASGSAVGSASGALLGSLGSVRVPRVWRTYSDADVAHLRELLAAAVEPAYDFALVGCTSPRRRSIVAKLHSAGLTTVVIQASFGDARDRQIANARALLNLHYAEDYWVYEAVRCNRWIAAGLAVVTEDCVNPSEIPPAACVFVSPDELIQDAIARRRMRR